MKKIILVFVVGFIINSSTAQEIKNYHLNGQLESVGIEKDGKRTGLWKFYHGKNDGLGVVEDKTKTGPLIMEGTYKDGKKTGEWKQYYNNGKLMSILNYEEGNLTGEWKQYYNNGKLEFIKNFKSGKQNGMYTHYDEKGELICKIEDYDENNPDIYISTYKSKSIIPAILKVIKSSENKLLIEGLKDFFGDSFTNSEELIKVSKHKYKIELKNLDKIIFEFTPYNSELILNVNTNRADMTLTFRKIMK
tara:strand:+ start:1874 stop:2617 length:744 start_codon:yes stop_codon:yes gene_type:complete